MGQFQSGGYTQKPTLLPEQMTLLQQILGQGGGPFSQQAAEGFRQFLPGGGGGDAIKAQAMKDYQQQTIPSILNAFGQGSKGSTSLNQALASSGSDLNTNLASMLSQLQLSASQGLGNLGLGNQQQALGTPGFSYLQKQPSILQQILMAALGAGGSVAGGYLRGRG